MVLNRCAVLLDHYNNVGRDYRPALFNDIASKNCKFTHLCFVDMFKTLVCLISPTDTKQVNRFLEK